MTADAAAAVMNGHVSRSSPPHLRARFSCLVLLSTAQPRWAFSVQCFGTNKPDTEQAKIDAHLEQQHRKAETSPSGGPAARYHLSIALLIRLAPSYFLLVIYATASSLFFSPLLLITIKRHNPEQHITSRTHTHPSHSQTSRLLTSSLSLGVPVPRATQCIRGV